MGTRLEQTLPQREYSREKYVREEMLSTTREMLRKTTMRHCDASF